MSNGTLSLLRYVKLRFVILSYVTLRLSWYSKLRVIFMVR